MKIPYLFFVSSVFLFATSCSNKSAEQHPPTPLVREQSTGAMQSNDDIQRLFEQRCTVCHGCYDAPCQLKLDAYAGLLRGAHKDKVYHSSRVKEATTTRLFIDAQSTLAWREKDFFPVLNEYLADPKAETGMSLLAQMLELKQRHPLPNNKFLPKEIDITLNREQWCPAIDEFGEFAEENPLWGMPYGLPALSAEEHGQLLSWVENGAQSWPQKQASPDTDGQIHAWETFLNAPDNKSRLVARYIFEHLFLAQIYFPDQPGYYLRLVRSATPPGQTVQILPARRPFEAPSQDTFYYRLVHNPSSVVAKNHMPYRLSEQRLNHWKALFFSTPYTVDHLPSYDAQTAANPFKTFRELPVEARYRFMLEEAQFTIMNFIKGPVCRGNVALNVIQDHFWVFFVTPSPEVSQIESELLADSEDLLNLPAEEGSDFSVLPAWIKYSKAQKKYFKRKARALSNATSETQPLNLKVIWDGDGLKNPNAALTVFRHQDSASVHQGLLGQAPKTAWIIDYPLLERIHYLLVAGFDVYGNFSHQLITRMYMDFLRMGGEMQYASLLPEHSRRAIIAGWYQDAEDEQEDYIDQYLTRLSIASDITYSSSNHHLELLEKLMHYLGPLAVNQQHDIAPEHALLQKIHHLSGKAVTQLPQIMTLLVDDQLYTLLRNNQYTNISSLFKEQERHRPKRDNTTLLRGIIGYYPDTLIRLSKDQLPQFVDLLRSMQNAQDYESLLDQFGVRRTSKEFWAVSDQIHDAYRRDFPAEYGILDYNRLENR